MQPPPAPTQQGRGATALRLLDPPAPAQLCPPDTIIAFGGERRIVHGRGPLRICGEWWSAPFARDYYEVLLEDGAHYWLFRDHEGRFFVQGIVD